MRFLLYHVFAIVLVLVLGTTAFAQNANPFPTGGGDPFPSGSGNGTQGPGRLDPNDRKALTDTNARGLASKSAATIEQEIFGELNPNDIEICNLGSVDMGEWNGVSLRYIKECGWTVRAVSLVRGYLLKTTEKWLNVDFGDAGFLHAYVAIILLLGVTLHGIKLTAGEMRNPVAETTTLLFKMAAVSYFTFNMDKYGHLPFALLDFLVTLPTKVLDAVLDEEGVLQGSVWGSGGLTCIYIPEDSAQLSLWMRIDCLMSRFFGVALIGGVIIAGGLLPMLFVLLVTAIFIPLAGFIFIAFVSILFFCVGAYLRAVVTYIRALLNLMVLVCVSVLFIPFAVLPGAVMGGIKGGAVGNLIKQTLDSIVVPFLLYTYLSLFIAICALSYQELYQSFVMITDNTTAMETVDGVTYTKTYYSLETCTPFGRGDWNSVSGWLQKAGNTAFNILDKVVPTSFNYPCFAEGIVEDIKNIALSATVLLLVTYLLFMYDRQFIALSAVIAGQFDTNVIGSKVLGKAFKATIKGIKSGVQFLTGNAGGGAMSAAQSAKEAGEAAKTAAKGGKD